MHENVMQNDTKLNTNHSSKNALHASSVFSLTIRDDFIGECNDVRASIADQGSLFTSVLVSDDVESEVNAEK